MNEGETGVSPGALVALLRLLGVLVTSSALVHVLGGSGLSFLRHHRAGYGVWFWRRAGAR